MFPILNPPPSSLPVLSLWVIPVHQPRASCIEPGLAIHFLYDIIHVSILFERHRHHSGYVKQRWNTSKTIGRFRNYVAKNVCQLSDAHILTWARNAAMRNSAASDSQTPVSCPCTTPKSVTRSSTVYAPLEQIISGLV